MFGSVLTLAVVDLEACLGNVDVDALKRPLEGFFFSLVWLGKTQVEQVDVPKQFSFEFVLGQQLSFFFKGTLVANAESLSHREEPFQYGKFWEVREGASMSLIENHDVSGWLFDVFSGLSKKRSQ